MGVFWSLGAPIVQTPPQPTALYTTPCTHTPSDRRNLNTRHALLLLGSHSRCGHHDLLSRETYRGHVPPGRHKPRDDPRARAAQRCTRVHGYGTHSTRHPHHRGGSAHSAAWGAGRGKGATVTGAVRPPPARGRAQGAPPARGQGPRGAGEGERGRSRDGWGVGHTDRN